ncbi:hypothetical protein LTR56_026706 [Elasticomyces elasticus]|nr:hypothetical protein LTR56_026706 [Elasticomyces elasticus]KAK5769551.1 hypothetical protein LTS12_000001 [Elasticomyces elasticus]
MSEADRQQLHLVMYVQQMLYSTGISVLELCKFSDRLVAEGTMSKNRLIVPSIHRILRWFISIFDTADQAIADDDRPRAKKEATLVYGSSTRITRNVEHLAPQNGWERFGAGIGTFQDFLRGPEFSFGFRSACATMSCAILAYLHQTQEDFTHYRLIWSVIIAAIGANMSAGQSGVSYVLRILGSLAALIICYLVWYIPNGHVAGVIILMWFASFIQMYFLIRWPRYIIGWLVILITEVLSIGYLCQVRKIGVEAATATGVIYYRPYEVVAVRVACVLWGTLASIFFTYFPYPITARGLLRKDLAVVMHLVANYHTVVLHTLTSRLKGTEGDMVDKSSQAHILSRRRTATFNKIMVLNSSMKHSVYLQKYEPTLGGKFPVAIYTDIISQLSALLDYIALISYSTQVWSTQSTHTQYFHTSPTTRQWLHDLATLIGAANASAVTTRGILYQLSGAVSTGRPLPNKIDSAKTLELGQALQTLDPELLHVNGLPDLGYSTYAVTELVSSMIAWKINLLMEKVESLVGITHFDVDHVQVGSEEWTQ